MNPRLLDAVRDACAALPLFPLPGVVFLPYTLLPLHVFEPRYRQLVKDALESGGVLAVPQLRQGWQSDYEGRPALHPIAGAGRIVRCQTLPDGRYNLLLLGVARVRIDQEPATDQPYRIATASVLEEDASPGGASALDAALRCFVRELMSANPALNEDLGRVLENADETEQLVYMLAHLALRDSDDRQRLLDADGLAARADLVMNGLAGLLAPGQPLEA